jgi:hypothetical protein
MCCLLLHDCMSELILFFLYVVLHCSMVSRETSGSVYELQIVGGRERMATPCASVEPKVKLDDATP